MKSGGALAVKITDIYRQHTPHSQTLLAPSNKVEKRVKTGFMNSNYA